MDAEKGKSAGRKYRELRKEIDGMLSALPGDWLVEEICLDREDDSDMWYSAVSRAPVADAGPILLVSGKGRTKAEALENILEGWRKGELEPYAPAAGSAEELRLKMAVRKG